MAGDWIKMRDDLAEDPAVISIAEKLGIEVDLVVGKLHRFWKWANAHTMTGLLRGVTLRHVDIAVSREGFADALLQFCWLEIAEDGSVKIPRFSRWNGKSSKKRALAADRQRRYRDKQKRDVTRNASSHDVDSNALRVEESRGEKKREEKNKNSFDPRRIDVPLLLNTAEFREAWIDWCKHRAEIKKKLTPQAVKQQLAKLVALGSESAVDTIKNSIGQGYTGLFEPTTARPVATQAIPDMPPLEERR